MKEIFDYFPIINSFIIVYTIVFGLFIFLAYFKKYQKEKIRTYTYDICRNDNRNYELLFNSLNEKVESEKIRNPINSQQAEAIQYFEKLAIGIKIKLLDESIVFDCYSRYFFRAYQLMKYAFLEYNNKANDPNLYIEYFKLLNKWKNQKRFENV